uniref:NACHT LRR and PYD domain-containing protein n=1 Tax=Astyanax mexicanus TaxID=7994 RepID=A0A3B1IZJ3_ASTMX
IYYFCNPLDIFCRELSKSLPDNLKFVYMLQEKLHDCGITEESCEALVKALKSNPSHLRELNMSWNNLTKLGVIELSDLLKDPQCKLKKLQLEGCSVAEEGCVSLLLALKSNPSHLKELSLSLNKTGDSGVKEISDLLKVPHCKLEKLQLWSCYLTEKSCAVLASALMSTCLKELDLSNNELQDSGVKKLSVGLENPEFRLVTLASVLSKNNSSLKELDLKNNKLQDSGAKELSVGLKNLHCKLEKLGSDHNFFLSSFMYAVHNFLLIICSMLSVYISVCMWVKCMDSNLFPLFVTVCIFSLCRLSNCSIRGDGCAALVRALNSNPSHLKELNLTLNIPGELDKTVGCVLSLD